MLPPKEVWRVIAPAEESWVESTLRSNTEEVANDRTQRHPCPNFNQARVIRDGRLWMGQHRQ